MEVEQIVGFFYFLHHIGKNHYTLFLEYTKDYLRIIDVKRNNVSGTNNMHLALPLTTGPTYQNAPWFDIR